MRELFSLDEFNQIKEHAYKLSEFCISTKANGFTYQFKSVIDGEYKVLYYCKSSFMTGGVSIYQHKFDEYLSDYSSFCEFVNKYNPYVRRVEENVQMTLF